MGITTRWEKVATVSAVKMLNKLICKFFIGRKRINITQGIKKFTDVTSSYMTNTPNQFSPLVR